MLPSLLPFPNGFLRMARFIPNPSSIGLIAKSRH
ncbi:hypothetical protein ACJ72_06658 [Emergomyces africanus]|uniref:Uncharacterized protein n=1 Tax=Emergomyces africanus TaxID=1955775 RepID=A0A1B7NQV9_9EURO|nr:hypothetical protein ACJ72_06658 [Emergomyces africanus]